MTNPHFYLQEDIHKDAITHTLLKHCTNGFICIDTATNSILACSNHLESFLGIPSFPFNNLTVAHLQNIIHPADWHIVEAQLQQIPTLATQTAVTLQVRIGSNNNFQTFEVKLVKEPIAQQMPVFAFIKHVLANQTNHAGNSREQIKLDELAFIASNELGHEYAKIQSIIQLLDNKYITDTERTDLIGEAKKSIQIINSSIFKFNHKLSYNQTDTHFEQEKNKQEYKKIVLIDDDVLTNVLNKKIINTVLPDKPLHIFLNIDDALVYLKEKDTEGDYMIFLDINFPDRNGWDFLNEYKNFTIKSKVVVLSSSIDNRDREKARSYELVIDYITKPLSMEFIKALFD